MAQQVGRRQPWYGHWWGRLLIGLLVFSFLIMFLFAVMTLMFWWQIKHGEKPKLGTPPSSSFTASLNTLVAGRIDRSRLETSDDPSLGRVGAPVTVVEFVDFKCPNSRAAAPIMDKVIARYGAKIHLIVRDFPVESTHPGATALSELMYCADQQHHFWPLYQSVFNQQDILSVPLDDTVLARLASEVGLNVESLRRCLAAEEPRQEVTTDYLTGISAGVRGTPTFFVNGEKIEGVIPFEAWERFLQTVQP